jgi:hypothetical protein
MDKPNGISKITIVRAGPEKAGVGGSSPSLATTLFKHLRLSPVPVWFHLVPKLKPGTPGFVSNPHFKQPARFVLLLPNGKDAIALGEQRGNR